MHGVEGHAFEAENLGEHVVVERFRAGPKFATAVTAGCTTGQGSLRQGRLPRATRRRGSRGFSGTRDEARNVCRYVARVCGGSEVGGGGSIPSSGRASVGPQSRQRTIFAARR